MSVKSATETRRQASAWKASTAFKYFAATRDTMARPTITGPFIVAHIGVENAAVYGFESADARDAFIQRCEGQAVTVDA